MGCCISKCRPNKHSLQSHQFNHLQHKLVISQTTPPTPNSLHYPSNKKISPSPSSPTSSISSFTCTTSNTLSSASSFSSASSSLTSKDVRSFSNEFLLSCYKENPHITRINSLRESTTSLSFMPTKPKPQSRNIINPSLSSMPQKRLRSNSPTNLTRQKSFRKEPLNLRSLSPSPSRRFSVSPLVNTISDNAVSKRTVNSSSSKVSVDHYSRSVSTSSRKESVKIASPNNSFRRRHSGLKHREACSIGFGSKIDETVVKDVLSTRDVDSTMMMEDIDNPLISLDCFIFL